MQNQTMPGSTAAFAVHPVAREKGLSCCLSMALDNVCLTTGMHRPACVRLEVEHLLNCTWDHSQVHQAVSEPPQ